MATCIRKGMAFVYGVKEARPIVNIPEGAKVRLRLRNDSLAVAFVKLKDRIDRWILQPADGEPWQNPATWKLGILQGVNVKP